jgi:hypothetical protein
MNRQEYLKFAKARAEVYLELGEPIKAFTSFASDLNAHPETKNHSALELGLGLIIIGDLSTVEKMRKFINGFN